jgi:hypothetical protein
MKWIEGAKLTAMNFMSFATPKVGANVCISNMTYHHSSL